jgi:hypothetical protein
MRLLQIRNVPDDVHRTLKSQGLAGMRCPSTAELRRAAESLHEAGDLGSDRRPLAGLAPPVPDAMVRAERDAVIVLDASAVLESS